MDFPLSFPALLNDLIDSSGMILIFIVFALVLPRYLKNRIEKIAASLGIDTLIVEFLTASLKIFLYVVVAIAILSAAGIETHSLVAAVGAAGLAIGLALQNSLSNLAAGLLLALNNTFKKGDHIEANGITGRVEKISLISTYLTTPENKSVIIPNNALMSGNIVNYSTFGARRVDLRITISYQNDITVVNDLIAKTLELSGLIENQTKPSIGLESIGKHDLNLLARFWVKKENIATAPMRISEQIKSSFDEQKIKIIMLDWMLLGSPNTSDF
ncbi:mechanosensitive ion channel [Litorivicinus sp.]|nr:mechanosensitive ion channel [Litorivicinus sp.]MDC1208135.1 mechanosensitive ion channel [Litorivicinus sp.]